AHYRRPLTAGIVDAWHPRGSRLQLKARCVQLSLRQLIMAGADAWAGFRKGRRRLGGRGVPAGAGGGRRPTNRRAPRAAGRSAVRGSPLRRLPAAGLLPFGDAQVVPDAHERLRGKLDYAALAFDGLPTTFTMTQLRRVYEAVQERAYDPTNFPRRMLARFPGLT